MANPKVTLTLTASAAPLTEGSGNVPKFLGSELRAPSNKDSLGGYVGPVIVRDYFNQLILGYDRSVVTDVPVHHLFSDVSSGDATSGKTYYRALGIIPDTGLVAPGIWFVQPKVGSISLWTGDTVNTDAAGNLYIQRITDENTAPSGASWSTPSSGSANVFAHNPVGGRVIPLWLKLTIPSTATPTPYDNFEIHIKDWVEQVWVFYHSIFTGYRNVTITGQNDGGIITSPTGEIYTINVADSGGTARDPAGNKVYLIVSSSFLATPREIAQRGNLNRVTGSFVIPAIKTATGVYRAEFHPPAAGHYQITFDVGGGEYVEQRSVEVSPIS